MEKYLIYSTWENVVLSKIVHSANRYALNYLNHVLDAIKPFVRIEVRRMVKPVSQYVVNASNQFLIWNK